MIALLGKNPKTTIAGILIAVAAVLHSGLIVDFSPAIQKWFVLAAMVFSAVGLALAKDAPPDPPALPPAASTAAKIAGVFACALVFAIAFAGCTALTGCTAAQGKAVVPVVDTVLTDIEKGCVVATMFDAIDPPLAADIAVARGIDASLVKLIEAEMPVGAAARTKLVAIEMAKPVGARRFGK